MAQTFIASSGWIATQGRGIRCSRNVPHGTLDDSPNPSRDDRGTTAPDFRPTLAYFVQRAITDSAQRNPSASPLGPFSRPAVEHLREKPVPYRDASSAKYQPSPERDMSSFDLYLERRGDVDVVNLLATLQQNPSVHATANDPSRFLYRNEDTAVHFTVVVGELVSAAALRSSQDEDEHEGAFDEDSDEDESGTVGDEDAPSLSEGEPGLSEGEPGLSEGEPGLSEGEPGLSESEPEDEDEDGDPPSPELPFVALSVPLFRPEFFLDEVSEFVATLQAHGRLELIDPNAGSGEDDASIDPDLDALRASWRSTHGGLAERVADRSRLCHWTTAQSRAFFEYGRARREFLRRLSEHSIDVPLLQPALHAGVIRSLCVVNLERPSIVPPSDLVLLQVPRDRKGLFRTKRVLEEHVIPGDPLWRILSAHLRSGEDPVPHSIYDPLGGPSREVLEAIDGLEKESVESAKRTELAGVVDFPLADDDGNEAGGEPES